MTGESPKDLRQGDLKQADPKKSDTLQIRIPHETKKQFLDACQKDRVSASDVLRRSILDYLRKRPSSQEKKGFLAMIPKPVRKKRYLAAGLASVAGLAVFAVMPSAADPNFHTAFQRLDANGDGKLDISEFTPMPFPNGLLLREARVNDTKGLPRDVVFVTPGATQAEIAPRKPAPLDAARTEVGDDFRRFDADGDGSVSYDEFQASLASMLEPVFLATDANHDGKLSREELDKPLNISANLVKSSLAPGPLPNRPLEESFRLYDRNGDGVVTFDEFVPQP